LAIDEDFCQLYKNLISCTEEELDNLYHIKPDVDIGSETRELGEVDHELSNNATHSDFFTNVVVKIQERGLLLHRCILAARSEYLRKVFKYETMPKCPAIVDGIDPSLQENQCIIDHSVKRIDIANFSLSTLMVICQYIYCGINMLKLNDNQHLLPIPSLVETHVECLMASELFLLYELKKYIEQQIISQINIMSTDHSSEESFKEFVCGIANLAHTYNADLLKERCSDLMSKW